MYYYHNLNELKACHRTWAEGAFLLGAIACNLHVGFSVDTEQNVSAVSADFNHMFLCSFVVVTEAEKLEVCIHKETYIVSIVEKLSEIHIHEWWYCQYLITISDSWQEIHSGIQVKNSNFEFEVWSSKNVSKLTYVCSIRETFKFTK